MSKKTRKEKIIADLRRKLDVGKTNRPSEQTHISTPIIHQENKTIKKAVVLTDLSNQEISLIDKNYFLADIRKTFLLTGIVVFWELVLFYFWK